MSRVSQNYRDATYPRDQGDPIALLITIDHPDLAAPLRVTSDPSGVVSRGETYVYYPFRCVLPKPDATTSARGRLIVDNVDRVIGDGLRAVGTAPSVTIEAVLLSDPDTVEYSMEGLSLTEAQVTALTVEATPTLDLVELEPFPGASFVPATDPGVFL